MRAATHEFRGSKRVCQRLSNCSTTQKQQKSQPRSVTLCLYVYMGDIQDASLSHFTYTYISSVDPNLTVKA